MSINCEKIYVFHYITTKCRVFCFACPAVPEQYTTQYEFDEMMKYSSSYDSNGMSV